MDSSYDKKYLSKRFWVRCVCLTLVFVAGCVFGWIVLEPFWLNIAKDKIIFDVQNLNNQEIAFLNSLISANKIHTAEFAFDKIVSFYETLITVIIAISAAFGIIGYLYIKSSHQRDIEDGIYAFCNSKHGENILKTHAQSNAKEYFSKAFKESLNDGDIKEVFVSAAQNADDIAKLSKDIDEVIERLIKIEDIIEKSDFLTYEEISLNESIDGAKQNINKNENIEEILLEKTFKEEVAIEIDTDNTKKETIEQEETTRSENNTEESCGNNTK